MYVSKTYKVYLHLGDLVVLEIVVLIYNGLYIEYNDDSMKDYKFSNENQSINQSILAGWLVDWKKIIFPIVFYNRLIMIII